MLRKSSSLTIAAALMLAALPSVTRADHHEKADIVDTAVKAGQFETLVAAVKQTASVWAPMALHMRDV